ncbi:MAG: hypothetical protein IJW28_04355 [Clostridia bacterium]|nr:hypothetical protein [Clostridia bacterium]
MMKKIIIFFVSMLLIPFIVVGCSCTPTKESIYGVWWWDSTLDLTYIDYAKEYNINEIYYCDASFNSSVEEYISYANAKKIEVYLLMGEYQWLYDDTNLINKIESYIQYNSETNAKFSGIHLDIEPHQAPEWKSGDETTKIELVNKLVKLAKKLKDTYPNIYFSYDIPFWLDHMVTIDGVEKEAYKHMIDLSHKVFLMSYRDTAEKIYDVSKDEIEYASSVNKTVVLGVEIYSEEGDQVSFMEEGKIYMHAEIDRLKTMVPNGTGVSIHHIKTWHDLKD